MASQCVPLPPEARDFIANSPFLFIGSRSTDGRFDVSPRGDDPHVLAARPDGTLLLADRPGNNRIDTLRNLLQQPDVCLAALQPGAGRYLMIQARAEVSKEPGLLESFAVRGALPRSVVKLHPRSHCFVPTAAFADAGFWSPPGGGVAPLKLRAIIEAQIAHHGGRRVPPGLDRPDTIAALAANGLEGTYAKLEGYVQSKAFADLDPQSRDFLRNTRFAALSFSGDGAGSIVLLGGAGDFARTIDDRHLEIRTRAEPLIAEPTPGSRLGGLFVQPGRNETLRLNGTLVSSTIADGVRVTVVRTEEIYLHCANSFARSGIWRPRMALAWNGTRRFVCRDRITECEGIASFLLAPEDDAPLGPFRPGQYVTVSVPEDPAGPPVQRCYSLSGAPGDDHFRITVRRHGEGAMSRWLHDRIRRGSTLRLGAPRGRFTLDESSSRTVALISAGVGVTPMISMLAHLARTAPGRPIRFIHGARNGREHAMRDLVLAHGRDLPGFKAHFTYSQPDGNDRPGEHFDDPGRIGIATLERLLDLANCDFYLCGPTEFMTSLKSGLEGRGVPRNRIRMELFGPAVGAVQSKTTIAPDGPSPTVTFSRSRKTLRWSDAAGSLLGLALNDGLEAPYICRVGDCQSCALPLASGEVAYPEELDVLPPEGYVLMCQATPVSDVAIEL